MLRMNEAIDLESMNGLSDDDFITQVKEFAKSDSAKQLVDTVKGYLSKPKKPATIVMPPTVAPTMAGVDWKVIGMIGAGAAGLGILAWALLRN